MKIDFVVPWVDGDDLEWNAKKNLYDTSTEKNYTNSSMRFRDWGTLRYVLRSIEQNAPWFNKIFLITEGHYPDWLDIEHEKIVLVTHDELYFDKTHLPTFSSPSIEMNLPNLQGLSDYFVYLNDDTFIMRPVEKNRFFVNGLPVDFFSHGWLPRNKIFEKLRGMNAWAHSIKNNIDLINREINIAKIDNKFLFHETYPLKVQISNFLMKYIYRKIIWVEHWHHPIPYLKKTLIDVQKKFGSEMNLCSRNRFRANNDLNQYIYRYYQLATGTFYPYRHNDGKFKKIESLADMQECILEMNQYTFYCPNDSVEDNATEEENMQIKNLLISKLEEIFPQKASFEINKEELK
jgi:hypothetical protein